MKPAPTHPLVLIVNDDPRVLELLNVLLEHEGYRVVSAESAARALEIVHKIEPDIVISDVVMPEMDGMELCRRLKQDARTAYLPVMLVSALRKSEKDSVHGLVAGADDYLEIPFRRQELLVKVARLTERHRVERHYRELVEQAADIIYTRDMQGRLTSINEAGGRFFGRPAEDLVGTPLSDLFGAEAAAGEIAETQHRQESDTPQRSIHLVRDAEGAQHYLEAMTTLVRDGGGQPTGVRGVVRDITELKQAEERLRSSEEKYRDIFNNATMGIYQSLPDGRLLGVNATLARMLGYDSTEELLQCSIARDIYYDEADRQNLIATHERSGAASDVEVLWKKKDGSPIWIHLNAHAVKDEQNHTVYYDGFVQDITERKQTKEALRQSEERLHTVIGSAPIILFAINPQGIITLSEGAGLKSLGVAPGQLVGQSVFDLYRDEPRVLDDTRRALAGEGFTTVAEVRGVWLETRFTAVRDSKGEVAGVTGLSMDITERKRAEEARHESEERYRELFENANDIIYTHDLAGNFTSLNKTGERITGYTREEAVKMNIAEILVPEQLEIARRMIARKESEKVATVYELEVISKGGARVALEVSTRLIYRDGTPIAVQGIARDVTERKRVKAELQASETELRALFAAMPDVIIVLDANGLYRKIAPTNPKLLYKPPAELIGKSLHDVLPPVQANTFLSYIRRALETRAPVSVEYSLVIEDTEVWFEGSVSPLMEDSVIWVARDITERKRAAEALAEQVKREELINRMSSAVRSSLDISKVFTTAVRELGLHLGVDRCSVYMKHDEIGLVRNMAEYHAPGVVPAPRDFSAANLKDLGIGIEQNGVLSFDDAAHDERIDQLYHRFLRSAGVRSIMYVAIKVGDEMPGAFALSMTRNVRHWSETDIALAKAVAIQTGIAIRQAELYRRAEATSAREALINRLSLAIRASLSLPEVLRTATRELGRALNVSHVHLRLYDPADPRAPIEHAYVAPNATSIGHIESSFDDPVGMHLLRTSQPLVIDDALNYEGGSAELKDHIRTHATAVGYRAQIDWPLSVNGNFRGALCIHQTNRARHWTEDELALVEATASQLATGIAQAELFEMTKRAKKEWETTFNAMSDGIFIFDRAGQLIRVNRAGAAMEDSWPHLLLGRHCCDILRTSSDEKRCIVENTLAEGRSLTIEVTPERFNRPLLVTAEPVIESGNRTVGVVCTARDLSELRKVEARAREHQSLLTNILESAREAIYAVDTEGYFQWCNSATVAAMGGRAGELIGHHFLDVTFEADRQLAAESFAEAVKGEPQSYEARFSGQDGQLRYALIDNAPIVVDGRITAVLGIARDITEQKEERERAAQADKLRALGQLASGVAHDFNNALAAILGRAQLMRRNLRDERLVHNLDIIQTAAEDAAATVRRIQTFARQSEAKEFDLLDASVLLRDAVEITRTRWQNEASMRGLFYAVEMEAEEHLYVSGNASELREVFVNLIVNAVDAMPFGGQILISSRSSDDRVQLCFADSGTGMTEEVRKRIFEPFYTTKGALGTGLGLAVSYGIIERHAGHINVESKLGLGTTFEIDLPAATFAPAPVGETLVRQETPTLKVLVIDDEDFVRETLADMLIALGHEVTLANGGFEAMEKLEADHFELVFTDLSMPGMDGWEVAREIRRRVGAEISIVLVTGYGKATALPPGEQDLVNGVIGKPFDFDQVSETIAKVTQKAVTSDK